MADAELRFPVLWISLAQGSMGTFQTYEALTTWGIAALHVGFQRQLHIFDSNLGHYEVIKAVAGKRFVIDLSVAV